jgi:hypothetical protein
LKHIKEKCLFLRTYEYLMMRHGFKAGNYLPEVVYDANETDGRQGEQDEKNERISEHPFPGRRLPGNLQILPASGGLNQPLLVVGQRLTIT